MQRATVARLVAAILVVLGGLALALAGEGRVELRVEAEEAGRVTVVVDGERHQLSLEDLADGETRAFVAGNHTLTVGRAGDRLTVDLDGRRLDEPAAGGRKMVWVTTGEGPGPKVLVHGDEAGPGHKRIVVVAGDRPEGLQLEDLGVDGAVKVIRVSDGVKVVAGGAPADRWVVHRCGEDGTTVRIPKDLATQSSYTCPVCGRVMERVEAQEVKVVTVVKEEERAPGER